MLSLDLRRQQRALDRAWDALVTDDGWSTNGVAPELTATLTRIHDLAPDPQPDPSFVNTLEGRLLQQTATPLSSVMPPAMLAGSPGAATVPVLPRPTLWRRTSRRAWPVMELAAVILLLLLVGGYFAGSDLRHPGAVTTGQTVSVRVSSDAFGYTNPLTQRLTAIDPVTLRDLAGQPAISLNDPHASAIWAEWSTGDPSIALTVSADGSTIAQIEPTWSDSPQPGPDTEVIRDATTANAATIVIRDARTGMIRQRITVPNIVAYPLLNGDGSRVIVHTLYGQPTQTWDVYATADGHRLATITIPMGVGRFEASAIDPTGTRLFAIMGTPSTTRYPQPGELVSYDLTGRGGVQRLHLADVPAGIVTYGKTSDGRPIQREFGPGIAVSPDGKTLALAHAESAAITLVNISAATPKVTRTFTPVAKTSLLDRVLAWLPLAPQRAAAKEEFGTLARYASFSADGKMLYVVGSWSGASQYAVVPLGVGLQAIDLTTGTETANLPRLHVSSLLPAPDGKTLYVFGDRTQSDPANDGDFVLRRLNGRTLQTQAQRGFPDFRWVVVSREGQTSVSALVPNRVVS